MKKTGKLFWVSTILFVIGALSGCATLSENQQQEVANNQMQEASKCYTINIESIPSGANVYGCINGKMGTNLGQTPLMLRYTWANGGLWGNYPEETLEANYRRTNPFQLMAVDFDFIFKCIVWKEGYKSYTIREMLWDAEHRHDIIGVGRSITFTAKLASDGNVSNEQFELKSPIQQQQQQQTVVIPDMGSKKTEEKGIVIVSANAENAEVVVDGIFMSNVPCKLSLSDGIHIIEVKLVGYKTFKKELRVIGGSEVTVRSTLEKE
jgi:hypothetical protein